MSDGSTTTRQVRYPAGLPSSLVPAVWRLSTAAYLVEAAIIGDDRIPALHLGPEAINRGGDWWLVSLSPGEPSGCPPASALVAVAHVEPGAANDELERLVVHPSHHRQGLGRALLHEVLRLQRVRPLAVGTGLRNHPAVALYRSAGFAPDPSYGPNGTYEPLPGLPVLRLQWMPEQRTPQGPDS